MAALEDDTILLGCCNPYEQDVMSVLIQDLASLLCGSAFIVFISHNETVFW